MKLGGLVQWVRRNAELGVLIFAFASLWLSDVAVRYLAAAALIGITLQWLEIIENWPKRRLQDASKAYLVRGSVFAAATGIVGAATAAVFGHSNLYWQSLDNAVMCYLMGFWAACAAQTVKGSLLLRSLIAGGVLCSVPFYGEAVKLVWAGHPPQIWLAAPTLLGAYGFAFVYGASREKGAPRSFAERLRLNDPK